jgi:hypothetical protein
MRLITACRVEVLGGKAEHFEWDDDIPLFGARRGGSRV